MLKISHFLKVLCLCIDGLVLFVGKLSAYLMPVLAFVVVLEVFFRYALGKPTSWAHELALFLFGYIAVLGGAYAHQKREHINVDLFYGHMGPKAKSICDVISFSLGIFFLLIMIGKSVEKLIEALEFNYRTQEWGAPMHHFWIMVIVGCSLFLMQLIRDIIANVYFLYSGEPLLEQEQEEVNN